MLFGGGGHPLDLFAHGWTAQSGYTLRGMSDTQGLPWASRLFMPNHANISQRNATTWTNGERGPGHNNCYALR